MPFRETPRKGAPPSRRPFIRGTVWMTAVGWSLIIMLPGCIHPSIMTQRAYEHYNAMSVSGGPGTYDASIARLSTFVPRTTETMADRQRWELSLEEAKRLALSNNPQVLAIATQPGQASTLIDLQLSQFDAFWSLGGGWNRADTPLTSNVVNAGTGQNAIGVDSFGQLGGNFGLGSGGFGSNSTTGGATQDVLNSIPGQNLFEIVKRNATGGQTSINYSLGYTRQSQVGTFTALNPSWQSSVSARIDQPFLQGAGVEFNRAGILIARANYEQTMRAFEVSVNTLLRDTEQAYWQLGYSYYDLYSREVGLEQALITWRKVKAEVEVGRRSKADLGLAREQLEFFRAARIQALTQLLAAERTLRLAIGLPPEDERQIIPADAPSIAEYRPDWDVAVVESVSYRPDIVSQTFAVRAAELTLARQQNGLYPDVTGTAQWGLTGLDGQFDQSIDRLTDGNFENWLLGLRFARQIGERSAHAAVRNAQLLLDQEKKELDNLRHVAVHELADIYRNIVTNYQLIGIQGDRRRAAATKVDATAELYRTGKATLEVVLEAQTDLADAIRDEGLAIAQYNQALIQWEFGRGTIQQHDNVVIAESTRRIRNDKLIRDRQAWWQNSLPMPVWRGEHVSADHFPCPTPATPFYPDLTTSTGSVHDDPFQAVPTEVPIPPTEDSLAPPPVPEPTSNE